jgi:UDP-glucose 4-epimerase
MHIVVLGGSGNLGTALIDMLAGDERVTSVVAVARRPTVEPAPTVSFVHADVTSDDLRSVVHGADVVVHLAWAIHPMHNARATWDVNVVGTHRIIEAVVAERVPALIYASSVGAYAPKPDGMRITEDGWPTTGIGGVPYAMEKAYNERLLDAAERQHPWCRIVRIRPALVLQGGAGSEYRRLFLGGLATAGLRGAVAARLPLPIPADLRFQVVHSYDVARATVAACLGEVSGPFHLAAEPVIGRDDLARALGVRAVRGSWAATRAADRAGFTARVSPLHPGWIDLIRTAPLLDTARARRKLAWDPVHDARSALSEAVDGVLHGRHGSTTPLAG